MPETRYKVGWLARGLLLVFGLLVALVLVEIGGRVVAGFEPLPRWTQRFNAKVGYELRPHNEYTYASVNGEFENLVRTNSRGLHDVEHTLDKPRDTFRILIVSDSYGQAREVPLAINFARQLEVLLNANPAQPVTFEVINAGQFGLGTTQEYLYYRYEGSKYDPDLVLLGFYVGNDVVDNHAPLIRAWNDINTVDFPYYSPDGTLHQPGTTTRRQTMSWLRNNVYLVHAIATGEQPDRVEVGDSDLSGAALRVPMGIYLPPDDVWQDAWAVTELVLGEFDTEVAGDDAQLAVFVIPDRRQLYAADWDATLARLPDLDPAALDRERPTRTVIDILGELDIPALNLLEPFQAADERLYFEGDGHFNPAGHTLTAQTLATWLVDTELIPLADVGGTPD
ncbi:MAG: hypothetical protein GYB65_10595 [Chloroflexi bacterium]|nr:hypothetical protein [Chloroflexota bacterium]